MADFDATGANKPKGIPFFGRRLTWPQRMRLPSKRAPQPVPGVEPKKKSRLRRTILWSILAFVVLYYPVGMLLVHRVNDDLSFGAADYQVAPGASRSVAVTAALIQREVIDGHWAANDPFFLPASALDNMPNFQQGMVAALARFTFELTDQIGRVRGSSLTDPDLQEAAGLLQYSGTKWVFDFTTSVAPTATSEAQYKKARRSLLAYNDRLAAGEAVFEARSDNLLATMDRIALDLGSSSALLDAEIARAGGWLETSADDAFYSVKGQIYAYYMLLRELQADFAAVIEERDLAAAYQEMLESFRAGVALDPWVIVNGRPDKQFVPNHLAAEGFYLLRARTQLREITNILLK